VSLLGVRYVSSFVQIPWCCWFAFLNRLPHKLTCPLSLVPYRSSSLGSYPSSLPYLPTFTKNSTLSGHGSPSLFKKSYYHHLVCASVPFLVMPSKRQTIMHHGNQVLGALHKPKAEVCMDMTLGLRKHCSRFDSIDVSVHVRFSGESSAQKHHGRHVPISRLQCSRRCLGTKAPGDLAMSAVPNFCFTLNLLLPNHMVCLDRALDLI
jgi:hypothetical protein